MSYDNYNNEFRRNRLDEPTELYNDRNLWTPTATQKFMLGGQFKTNIGDEFRYCKNGSTQIAKALLIAAEQIDAQQKATIQTAYGASAGDKKFEVLATTGHGVSNHELIDGLLLVNDGSTAAMGDLYTIKDNIFVTDDTVWSIEIADEGGVRNVIAATDDLSFFKNPYHSVIVKPTTLTGPIVGATLTIIPANYYFWAKIRGITALLVDNGDSIVEGEPVGHIDGSNDAGSIGLVSTHATDIVLGVCMYPSTGDEAALIRLDIP